MANDKAIIIKCEGKEYIDINDLVPFQGKLKSITSDDFNKLKRSLIKDGLPLGFHIWKDKGKNFIMDGHHRQLVMKSLRDDGYFIAPVPCNPIIANSKKEAAKAILVSNSKYARMSESSISDYMIEHELSIDDLLELDIQELNMDDFKSDDDSIKNISSELDLEFKFKIEVDCESEEKQQDLFKELEDRGFKIRLLI